ncbi:hypothetical protein RJ641_015052 [Dillenia turbinata]|uniref:LysM domain-containing protein n=1 Tax=Dillenia turbinata TaxID=194707 RepID=A0AAN8YZY5_9MAGN
MTSSTDWLATPSSSASSSSFNGESEGYIKSNGVKYMEHNVSNMDTLAGVAIKYGVEVSDIKKINGLATDLQMFALKTLQIPLPGKHPPSPSLTNGSSYPVCISCLSLPHGICLSDECLNNTKRPPKSRSNVLESFQTFKLKPNKQKVSPAMSSLQSYYGLKAPNNKWEFEGTEIAVYNTRSSQHLDDELLPKASQMFTPALNQHQKLRISGNGFLQEKRVVVEEVPLAEARDADDERSNEKSVRRRQKAEVDSGAGTPVMLLKDEQGNSSGGSSGITGKGLSLRPKSASRIAQATDDESSWLNPIPVGLGDSLMADGLAGVRKSSSTPAFQNQDNNISSSVWPTSMWSLKPDLQSLSAAAITKPIFDNLMNPLSGLRNKPALD